MTMSNIELTLDQLGQLTGAGKAERQARRAARRAARKERRALRKHNRTCDKGWQSKDCPLGPDSESGVEHTMYPGCTPWGPC